MNLFFDIVTLLFALILQLVCGDIFAFPVPFSVCALLALAMRRKLIPAVITALAAGFILDFACGREFASCALAMPLAVAVAGVLLPVDPIRFTFADYILPGAAAGGILGVVQLVTPLFFGEEWFYLARNSAVLVTSLLPGVILLPLTILTVDRLAKSLEVDRIFKRTIAVALRSARR